MVHEFYRLKAWITLEQVITSVVEKKNNLNEFTGKGSSRDRGSEIDDRLQKLDITEIQIVDSGDVIVGCKCTVDKFHRT